MKKIRIQRVSAFDIIITLALAVVFVALSLRGTGELTQMQRATEQYGVGKGTRTLDPRNHNPML